MAEVRMLGWRVVNKFSENILKLGEISSSQGIWTFSIGDMKSLFRRKVDEARYITEEKEIKYRETS